MSTLSRASEDQPTYAQGWPPPELLESRELSWIAFNQRVLDEAMDSRQPLLERVKFAAIFGSNLDEYFMVRVSGLQEQAVDGSAPSGPDGRTPAAELAAVYAALKPAVAEHRRVVVEVLLPALAERGVRVAPYRELDGAAREGLRHYFEEEVFPVCTPLAIDPGHPFPLISNLSLNLAVLLDDPDGGRRFARVKVPNVLPRLVAVPEVSADGGARATFVWLEEILEAHLDRLFPGMHIAEAQPFRVIRDAEIEIQQLEAEDLLESIEAGLSQRRFKAAVALFITPTTSEEIRDLLAEHLDLDPEEIWEIDGPLGLSDVMELTRVSRADLKDAPFNPRHPVALHDGTDLFAAIRHEDLLLHHPFDSFEPVVDLVCRAATDPQVLAIKQTLYRVGSQSPIVQALRLAADEGKQVAVMVELKARFDEENNIEWARSLEQAGVHVTYGLPGLKTHAKLALVVRREADGLRRYVHVGTGNYNPQTARQYTDLGLLTCNREIAADVSEVFNLITGYSKQRTFRRLLVAPVAMRDGLFARIEREIEQQRRAGDGRLIFKLNALVDPAFIQALYKASQAGVRVDLLVRGMCCLRPGLEGISERVRVVSVVGRFLEHSRVFYFHNGGEAEVLIGSADLMPRNLDHRVEVLVPIQSASIKRFLRDELLETYLADNVQAWELGPDGSYRRLSAAPDTPRVDAQTTFMQHAAVAHA